MTHCSGRDSPVEAYTSLNEPNKSSMRNDSQQTSDSLFNIHQQHLQRFTSQINPSLCLSSDQLNDLATGAGPLLQCVYESTLIHFVVALHTHHLRLQIGRYIWNTYITGDGLAIGPHLQNEHTLSHLQFSTRCASLPRCIQSKSCQLWCSRFWSFRRLWQYFVVNTTFQNDHTRRCFEDWRRWIDR